MKTLTEKQMKAVRTHASTLNMEKMDCRKKWTKEQAVAKVRDLFLSGKSLSKNQYIVSPKNPN